MMSSNTGITTGFLLLVALGACTSPGETGLPPADTGPGETAEPVAWGEGPRTIAGKAWFFDMPTPGTLEWLQDVAGAEVYVFEAPELRATLDPADEHAFRFEGLPEGVGITLAVTHPDFYPHLTATLRLDGSDVEDLSFQVVSRRIAALVGSLLETDEEDDALCQMSTTVTAEGDRSIWAPGEPGATVTVAPEVPAELGPVYFNEHVIPDRTLSSTSTDGGVIVVGAEPGLYTWDGHKDGFTFDTLEMRCEGGWLTNAAPPWGMNAHGAAGSGQGR